MNQEFNYKEAFSRNLGLLTENEQEKLKQTTIVIPGMGGVGGAHLIALVRQGFEKFKISDMDNYEIQNFNRQYGARVDTIGRPKVEVMKEEALRINPNCQIQTFPAGINENNIDIFLEGADLSVDALDAFAIDVRRLFFNSSLEKQIPVITAGPIGFGTAFFIFMPGGPTFDDYFAISDKQTEYEKIVQFMVGIVPSLLQRSYMKKVNLSEKRGPSSAGAVQLCAGIIAIYAIKILLKKGKIRPAPYYHQFDVMLDKYVVKRLWFGNRNPLQKIKIKIAKYLVDD